MIEDFFNTIQENENLKYGLIFLHIFIIFFAFANYFQNKDVLSSLAFSFVTIIWLWIGIYFIISKYLALREEIQVRDDHVLKFQLEHAYKRHDDLNNECKQIQTISGLIISGTILLLGLIISLDILDLFKYTLFIVSSYSLVLCLEILVLGSIERIPPIGYRNRSDVYKIMNITNNHSALNNAFSKFLLITAIFLLVITLYILTFAYLLPILSQAGVDSINNTSENISNTICMQNLSNYTNFSNS